MASAPQTVMTILGTRPEAIKMAPVVKALQSASGLRPIVVSTGQHREMLRQILAPFSIQPDIDLGIMRESQSLNHVLVAATKGLDALFARLRPDIVLVQGDTTTACAGALAAFYAGLPVGHVEAGLRTYDTRNPYPEEVNRRVIALVAELHFASTPWAAENLSREGVPSTRVVVTGNTVIDCLFEALKLHQSSLPLFVPVERLTGRRLVLVTAHRRENWDHGLGELCLALRELVQLYPDVIVLFPVHLNPIVRRTVFHVLGSCERVLLVDPLPYWAFIEAMERAFLILTDSGGVQEEAPSLGKPVLVVRDTTERPEAVFAGSAHLVGNRRVSIMEGMRRLLDDPLEYERFATPNNPFGDGRAAGRIVAAILNYFGRGEPPQPFVPAQKERVSHVRTSVASA